MKAREDLVEQVRAALRGVIDPELGYSVVDLGLIYELSADEGRVRIVMTATTPGCPATGFLRQGVESSALAVPDVESVDVTFTFKPRWTPSMMTSEAKSALGFAEVH
jgi:metal-sulfur cluster biosynthetic enzyme